jgi:hypothetical protein
LYVAFEVSKSGNKKTGFSVMGNSLKELENMLCYIDFSTSYWEIVNQHTDEHYKMFECHKYKKVTNGNS